jgi:hypothetical protein
VGDLRGAAVQALVGIVLGQLLAALVELAGVADVGEGQVQAGGQQALGERDRVVVVRGAVVGDDRGGADGGD